MPYFLLPDSKTNSAPLPARVSLAWAVLAFAILLLWQFLTVRYNRDGNWTALFCTGQHQRVPPELDPGTYRFPNVAGYDGQMYRYVAHDPLLRRGYEQYVDFPEVRYRRILVPALAFALAGGYSQWIDAAYIAVVGIFVLLGAYWLSRWAWLNGFHPAWGLTFALTPAALISMDRMTVDGALTALTVGFAYFWKTGAPRKIYLLLALACLTRETGVLLVGGCCIFELLAKRFTRSLVWATAGLPALAWYLFVHVRVPALHNHPVLPRWFLTRFVPGLINRMFHPLHYPFPAPVDLLARSLDVTALAAILCAAIMAIVLLRRRLLGPVSIAAALFAFMALSLTSVRYWDHCYGYARVFSPLLVLVALHAMTGKRGTGPWWMALLPSALVDLRVGLELGSQTLRIVRGLLGV